MTNEQLFLLLASSNKEWWQDLLPFATATFSVALGALTATYVGRRKELNELRLRRVELLNSWVVELKAALESLIAIKKNYNKKLSSSPYQRFGMVRQFFTETPRMELNPNNLSFVIAGNSSGGADFSRISALVQNFNHLVGIWNMRDKVHGESLKRLSVGFRDGDIVARGEGYTLEFDVEYFERVLGQMDSRRGVDLTERCVTMTDFLIVELNEVLRQFPNMVEGVMGRVAAREVLKYKNVDYKFLALLEPCMAVDYEELGALYALDVDVVREMYSYSGAA